MTLRSEQAAHSRAHLLRVAAGLFAENGYAGTSTAQVLDAAAVSRGALYHHFSSKERLFEAVLDDVEAAVAARLADAARDAGSAVDALSRACKAFLALARDPVVGRIVLLDAPAAVGWQKWRAIDHRHAFGLLKPVAVRAAADAGIEPGCEDELSHVVLASVLELAMLVAHAEHPAAALRRAERAMEALLDRLFATR